MLDLPSEFIHNIEGVFGEAGKQFLANLPASIEEAAHRWSLTDVQPSPDLSYNFVAFANRGASTAWRFQRHSAQRDVVLKMGVPNREFLSEIAALRLFNAEGACKLIDYDEEKYWMLLERLRPGVMLAMLEDDEEATHIAADVMPKIWRFDYRATNTSLRSAQDNFIKLVDWFEGLKRLRAAFNGGTGPLKQKLVERVESSVKDFFVENHKSVLMHGDFHHYNLLASERGWLVIRSE